MKKRPNIEIPLKSFTMSGGTVWFITCPFWIINEASELNGSYQIGLYSPGSAHLVRAPQALETQQHGENALEFTIEMNFISAE